MADTPAEAPAPDLVTRLRAGYPCKEAAADGCCKVMDARSGCLCAEAAAEITRLRAEVERLRAALEAWNGAVRIDVLMEGSRYMGVEPSRGRHAWELTRAALNPPQEPRT